MSQELLNSFAELRAKSDPLPAGKAPQPVGIGHNRPPAGVPRGVLLTFTGAFGVLLLALAAPAMGAAPFPLIFAICAICFAAYFGGALKTPIFREAQERGHGADVATGSGTLTAREAAGQILPLPLLLAGFGIFAMAAKAAIL